MSGLQLTNVTKRFGSNVIIHEIDLTITPGEFVVFVGPSGCGKSTLLRMISGLEDVSSGKIYIGGRDVTGVDPAHRGVAMVFQSYALFPHMTVAQNMGFGLRVKRLPKAEAAARVDHAAEILQLAPLMNRKPAQLSGGQRQRVAIGRAIVREPEVFLFDEPLSNLDAELRVQMRTELTALHAKLGTTMIYVTHDQVEAMTLADKIVILRAGRVEQVGAPLYLYDDPDNIFVAGFLGSPRMNLIKAVVNNSGGLSFVRTIGTIKSPIRGLRVGQSVIVGCRPEHIQLTQAPDLTLDATAVEHLGSSSFAYSNTTHGEHIAVELRDKRNVKIGSALPLTLPPDKTLVFDADTGYRLRNAS